MSEKDLVDNLEKDFDKAKESAKEFGAEDANIKRVKKKRVMKRKPKTEEEKSADANAKTLLG